MTCGRRVALMLVAGLIAGVAVAASTSGVLAQGDRKPLLVFAAASLKNALDAVNGAWAKNTSQPAKISYAASSTLAKQIEEGAPADIFISADLDWMDYLAKRNLIAPETRSNLLGNKLVLIAPRASAHPVAIEKGFDLAKILGNGRLAMADVAAVPAGKYGKAALETLGVWDSVSGKIAQAENVRAALLLVSRGEAPAGIVYATDAAVDPNVTVIGTFPDATHPPIIYPVALTKTASPDAAAFLAFVKSPAAKPLFEAQGFTVLAPNS